MKKPIRLFKSTKNTFFVPLLVVCMLLLGVVVYASLQGTESRSKAANPVVCTMAKKTVTGLVCPSGSLLQGNLCCTPPVPTPKPVCKTGVDSLCMNTPCTWGYRYATVTCLDGFVQDVGDATSCKTAARWNSYGEDVCKSRSICSYPTPTSCVPKPPCVDGIVDPKTGLTVYCTLQSGVTYCTTSTPCTPRPACLDANPPCMIKLASGSAPFCPKSTETQTIINSNPEDKSQFEDEEVRRSTLPFRGSNGEND